MEWHYIGVLPCPQVESADNKDAEFDKQRKVDRERVKVMILQPFPGHLEGNLDGNLESTWDVTHLWSSYQERLCREHIVKKLGLQAERHQTRVTSWLQAKHECV
jgi:hypothetical protein